MLFINKNIPDNCIVLNKKQIQLSRTIDYYSGFIGHPIFGALSTSI